MKQYVCKPRCNILTPVFTLILVAFVSIYSNAQGRKVNPAIFRNYIKPNSSVTVKTVAAQKVRESTTTPVNNIFVPDTGKIVVLDADRRITQLDAVSLKKYASVTKGKLPSADVKMIPETHLEAANGEAIAYRILFTMKQPLSYDANSNSFKGKIGFLLMSDSDNTAPVKEPVKIEVRSDKTRSIVPDKFAIDHLSIESTDVDLEVAGNVTDSIGVRVGTVSNPEGYVTFIKVEPGLEISSNRKALQGLGIEETEIDVELKGSTSADSAKVVFSAEKGTITPSSISVKYSEPAIVTLRSEGLGDSKISASTSRLNSNSLVFVFKFPLAFLLAALIGGLSGGVVKFLSSDKTRRKKSMQKIVIGGILTGLIVAAAYYGLGISVIGIKISALVNEIAVFALSALGAIVGISLPKPGSAQ